MEGFRTWSVGTDDHVVIASLPEPLRFPSSELPEWMSRASTAIREELRLLAIDDGTVLEATLAGEAPAGTELDDVLLYDVGVPEAHVQAGVRLRRAARSGASIVQSYRRVPAAPAADDEDAEMLAAVQVPLGGILDLDSAGLIWLATRRAVVAALPAGPVLAQGGIDLRARVSTGPGRNWGSVELIKRLLEGLCGAFHTYAGASLEEAARRLAVELRQDPAEIQALASSERGAVLGPYDYLPLNGERVTVRPAADRIEAVDIAVAPGEPAQVVVEVRAI